MNITVEKLNKLQDNLMDKLFNEKIMNSIIDTRHIETMHSPKNNTDITLIERAINTTDHTKGASVFDEEPMELIEDALMDSVPSIIQWLINSKDKILTLTINKEHQIGHGISYVRNELKEYTTEDITIILTKSDDNIVGFTCATAYPNISPRSTTRTPTGRNLIPDLAQTRTFKKSDTEQRKSLIRSAMCSMDKTPAPMDYVCADIITDAAYTEDTRAIFDKDEIRLIHYEGTIRAGLNITKDSVKLTGNHSREMITLKKTAEQSIENRFGTKLNIQKIREPKEKQKEISEGTDKDLTKGKQFGE